MRLPLARLVKCFISTLIKIALEGSGLIVFLSVTQCRKNNEGQF